MKSKNIPLKELRVYKESHAVGQEIWELVSKWNFFDRNTLGKQMLRAADSISLNISEGYGRYFYKENKQFCYYSRGSLFETAECLIKANERGLIGGDEFKRISKSLIKLKIRLNNYISSIGKN
jgi:four helix bundle protein